jgi:hypothetical protein
MLMIWIPSAVVVTTAIGAVRYLVRRYIERRRDAESLALLIQTADLNMKLRQSGSTVRELRALQQEVLCNDWQQSTIVPSMRQPKLPVLRVHRG